MIDLIPGRIGVMLAAAIIMSSAGAFMAAFLENVELTEDREAAKGVAQYVDSLATYGDDVRVVLRFEELVRGDYDSIEFHRGSVTVGRATATMKCRPHLWSPAGALTDPLIEDADSEMNSLVFRRGDLLELRTVTFRGSREVFAYPPGSNPGGSIYSTLTALPEPEKKLKDMVTEGGVIEGGYIVSVSKADEPTVVTGHAIIVPARHSACPAMHLTGELAPTPGSVEELFTLMDSLPPLYIYTGDVLAVYLDIMEMNGDGGEPILLAAYRVAILSGDEA